MRLEQKIYAATLIVAASSLPARTILAQAPNAHRVMLDEAHHNIMATASGGYRPLVALLTDAEFDVTPNTLAFTRERLATTNVVVIANPNGAAQGAPLDARAAPAFADAEIDALEEWVKAGGGLLLATDHYPTGVAAQRLAERFGVKLSGGWTDDPEHRRTLAGYGPVFGYLVFSIENGLLTDHPITRGRYDTEQIEGVSTTTGGSMQGPPGSVSLLRLGSAAVDWIPSSASRPLSDATPETPPKDFNPCPSCDRISSAGHSQGIAFAFGRGRVVVIAEMGALVDYSVPGMQNAQFALNAVRWLARDF